MEGSENPKGFMLRPLSYTCHFEWLILKKCICKRINKIYMFQQVDENLLCIFIHLHFKFINTQN
jgi:hypothetical protein